MAAPDDPSVLSPGAHERFVDASCKKADQTALDAFRRERVAGKVPA